MMSPLRVALVGTSGYGDTYLQSILGAPASPLVSLVGVADPEPGRCRWREQLARDRVPFHGSIEELLARCGPLDLLMLATPIHLHAPHACMGTARGTNVLCEKPLAGSLADAQRMLAAERRGPGFIAIGYQWSFSSAVQRLKGDVMSGRYGRPRRLRTLVSFPRPTSYYARNDWAGRLAAPGGEAILDNPVNNAAAHYLHNMLWILGPTPERSLTPESVTAELYRANRIETYDTAALRVAVPGGADILFLATHAARERLGPMFRFEFEEGVVTYDPAVAVDVMGRLGDGTVVNYGNPNHDRNEKIWQCVAAIRRNERPICTVASAMPHTLCVLAAQRVEVRGFDAAELETCSVGDDTMLGVRGLGDVLLSCFAENALPSELGGVGWAGEARLVEVAAGRGVEEVASFLREVAS
jgi:predicted dehydrogenase